jgi:hypothetical protein
MPSRRRGGNRQPELFARCKRPAITLPENHPMVVLTDKYGFNRPAARSAAMMGVCGQPAVLGLNLTKRLRGAAEKRGIALAA